MKPTRRLQRVLAVGTAIGLAVFGLAISPHGAAAGLGHPSDYCTDGGGGEFAEIPIMPSPVPGPISLSLEVGTNSTPGSLTALENIHLALCYSDTPPGTPSSLAGGHIYVMGPQLGSGSTTPQVYGACLDDPGVTFQTNCSYSVTALVTPTSGSCGLACGATVTISIPFSLCAGAAAGTHPVGSSCTVPTISQTLAVAQTGVIVSTLGINPGPNGTKGVSTPTTTLWVNGSSVPLTAGAGVVPGTIGFGTTNNPSNPLLCLGPLGCPGAWVNIVPGTLAWLVIPGVGAFPVNTPPPPPGTSYCFDINSPCQPPPYPLP
jgi:hypothetical protein